MVDNSNLREDRNSSNETTNETFDVNYLRSKFNVTTREVMNAIREVKSNNEIDIEEYLSANTGIPRQSID